jgi:type II secretory pathway component GspD/PulD (secretin)
MVKDGETIIMGGLIRKERSETITRLPFFSDIPILGRLFTHRYKDKDKDRELLVFITPRIVKDNNIELAQAKNINIPEREQSTASGIDRSDAINTSLNNFEKKRK